MGAEEEKLAWMNRVLGVFFPDGKSGNFGRLWPDAKSAWTQAIEQVDSQIGKLQSALKASGDDQLVEIAEYGLNGVTGNYKVRLMAAIVDVDHAAPDRRAAFAKRAASLVEGFRSHLLEDPRIAACDGNPFGVSVSIRSTIAPALADLTKALAAA